MLAAVLRPALVLLLLPTAEVALSVQQADPLRYPPSDGRVLWLRADRGVEVELGNTVPGWSGLDAPLLPLTQSQGSSRPLFESVAVGGRAALRFDGDDWLGSASGMPTGDYTKVCVVVLDSYGSNNNVLSGAGQHALFYGGSDRAQLYHSGTFVTSSTPTPLGEATILVGTYDASTGEGRLYQNGALVGSGFAAAHSEPSIQIGAFAAGNFLQGAVPELLVYDRVLSGSERQWVEGLLDASYRSTAAPRVAFTARPFDAQVLQRDQADQARVVVAGSVETLGYDQVELRIRRDGAPWSTVLQSLVYGGAGAPFAFDESITAGLHDHDVVVALLAAGERTVVRRIDSIACGDTLLLAGQSNTVAADYWGEGLGNQSQSPWIRSFGSSVANAGVLYDLRWGLADGETFNAHATVGSWGLRAAELLVQQEQVPIGLINGAVGGTAIIEHLRDDGNPTNPSTIYGRLLYRARAAQIDTGARALLWYQGESDGENVGGYTTRFATLHAAWQADYPALEKIYLFQIRKGCGVAGAGVREFLRTAPDVYADLEVMSTTAAPGHDGCHFVYAGYRELGNRIARVLARDIHGSPDTQEIDPPNIASAQRVGLAGDRILLTFRDPDDGLVWEPGSEAYFSLSDAVVVTSGAVAGNRILLQLAGPTTATTITYDGHVGDGPWVRNARGVGALTFFDFPVAP